jgi:Ca2+/Na+ antiporter
MEEEKEEGILGGWGLVIGIIMFYVGIFWTLHGMIKKRATSALTVHAAGFTILFLEIFGTMLLYDRVLKPDLVPRWFWLKFVVVGLVVFYVFLYIKSWRERRRFDNDLDSNF